MGSCPASNKILWNHVCHPRFLIVHGDLLSAWRARETGKRTCKEGRSWEHPRSPEALPHTSPKNKWSSMIPVWICCLNQLICARTLCSSAISTVYVPQFSLNKSSKIQIHWHEFMKVSSQGSHKFLVISTNLKFSYNGWQCGYHLQVWMINWLPSVFVHPIYLSLSISWVNLQ